MAISIEFKDKYVYFGPEAGLHTQGEARAEVYDVTGPRYHDGHDLSAMTWYVRASHPDYMTLINKQLGVSVDPDNEGQIIITWPVEADFTAYAGQLDVQFVAKSSTGEEIIKLQSNGLEFAPSVEGTAMPPKNVFENTLKQMQGLLDNAENAAAQSAADASRAEDAQDAAAQSAQQAQQAQQAVAGDVEQAAVLVEQIEGDAEAAAASAAAAKASENAAAASKNAAASSASEAKTSETNAASSKTAAANSAAAAATSEANAASSKSAAASSAAAAKTSETNAASSKTAATNSAAAAAQSEAAAEAAAQRAEDAAETVDMSNYLQKNGDGAAVTVPFTAPASLPALPSSPATLEALMTMLASMRNRLVALEESIPGIGEWWYSPNVITYTGGVNSKAFARVNFNDDLSKTVYAALYAKIGDSLSSGAADGFFNCKKLAERFPLAYGANFQCGATGGSFKHLMTLNELVAHNHPVTNGNGVYTWDASSGASTVSVLIEPTTNNTKPVNISVGNRGGGQAMDITNPYLAQNIIVRAL